LTIPQKPVRYEGDALIAYDPDIGFVANPGSRSKSSFSDFAYSTYHNERSARVSVPGERSPDRVEIVTVGCSFSWGHGVENEETFAVRVARELGVTHTNLAMAGYGTVHSLLMLRRNRDLSPKIVVYGLIEDHLFRNPSACARSFYPFCLDVAHVVWDSEERPRIARPLTNGVRRVAQHIKAQTAGLGLLPWVVHGLDVVLGRVLLGMSSQVNEEKQEAALSSLLNEMSQTTEAIGAKLLVVFIPTNYQPPSAALRKAVAKAKVDFVDTTEDFKRAAPKPYLVNDGHPGAYGHALVADAITKAIRERRLLDRASKL
jgi:hypothetical protein